MRTATAPSRVRTRLEGQHQDEVEAVRAVRAWWAGLAASVLATLAVVLTAIDTQSGLVPDVDGHSWAFSLLFGPARNGLHREGWTVLTTDQLPDRTRFLHLLHAHLAVDLVFIAVYAVLLDRLVQALRPRGAWRLVWLPLVTLVAADVVEDVLALLLVRHVGVLGALLLATQVKWASVAALALVVAVRVVVPRPSADPANPTVGTRLRRSLRRAVTAVVHQRFSYAPLVVLFVLSVPSGSPILEQLPDAQREWVFDATTGRQHAVAAITCTALLGAFLLAVGRERTQYALRPDHIAETRGRFGVWLVGPALALVGVGISAAAGHGDLVLGLRTAAWVAVPLAVVVASLVIAFAWWFRPRWYRPYEPPRFDDRQAFAVGIAGTVAAAGAVVNSGLSLVRALTPLVVLPESAYTSAATPDGWVAGLRTLLVVAALAIVGPWLGLIVFTRHYGGPRRSALREPTEVPTGLGRRIGNRVGGLPGVRQLVRQRGWLLLAAALAIFLGLGVYPSGAAWLGLGATATLALGSLAGMLSGVGLVLQEKPTAEVFRLLRLRRTPLVSVLVLTVLAVNAFASTGTLHAVDRGTRTPLPSRPSVDQAFADWLGPAQPCGLSADGRPVPPMLMIAAEGGGIRATYWTVKALQAMDAGTCAGTAAFFSGGASGGSVGLTAARFSGAAAGPGNDAAVAAVRQMARPETLSEAADGTFVRDLLYGASGVPVPDLGQPDPYGWLDRARLIERGWTAAGAWGGRRFLDQSDVSPATGALVLNSTSVKNNCRVWLSQLQLPGEPGSRKPTFDAERDCDDVGGVGPRTIDLFAAYGPLNAAGDRRCLDSVSAATAALLTARFPYVTPSGVVCPRAVVDRHQPRVPYWPRTQLVDGGYVENSGLATVTDLSSVWLPLVRQQNDRALADLTRTTPLVVPVVVYLENGDRRTVQAALNASPVSELAVPPLAYLAGRTALSEDNAQLARARQAVEIGGFCPTDRARAACSALAGAFPSRVVVVDRATQPEIAAPLGWVLSQASMTSLDHDMAAQQATLCPANRPAAVAAPVSPEATAPAALIRVRATCRPGLATLGDLRRYLTQVGY